MGLVEEKLGWGRRELKEVEDGDLVMYVGKKVNGGMGVWGMVKNVGEGGGGGLVGYNGDGRIWLEIVERWEIEMKEGEKKGMLEKGRELNGVDLVCGVGE